MRIVLELTFVRSENKITGVERVALESIKHVLSERLSRGDRFYVLCAHGCEAFVSKYLNLREGDERVRLIASPFGNRIANDQLWLPYAIGKIKPDYVYYTTLGIPLVNRYPFCMIVHDAVAWEKPDTISKGMKYYYKPVIERALRSAKLSKVITVSQFSKGEILKHLKVDPRKMFVNYLGTTELVRDAVDSPEREQEVMGRFKLPADYITTIGTIEPRKNLQGLIDAYRLAREKYEVKEKLVIIGRSGWKSALRIDDNVREDIIFTGYVSNAEMNVILKRSKAFIFPSFYEGFGLPMIEAMSLGVPVVSSDQASLPEIGGTACAYFNPYDAESMAAKIRDVVCSEQTRMELAALGARRSELFTWEKHAKRLMQMIRSEAVDKEWLFDIPFWKCTLRELVAELERKIERKERANVHTVNVDHLVIGYKNKAFQQQMKDAAVVVADGMPIVWYSKLIGRTLPERVTGVDLCYALCESSSRTGSKIYFLGAGEGVAEAAARNMEKRYPGVRIVGTHSPSPQEVQNHEQSLRLVETINKSGANILLVAFGAPKQEIWISRYLPHLEVNVSIGVGATLDFMAGTVKRSPVWLQRLGLEWLYRLLQEPKRLFKRYIVNDSLFFLLMLRDIIHMRKRVREYGKG